MLCAKVSKCICKKYSQAHTSISSIQDLRTGGCWLDLWLGRYSFSGLMTVIATEFIPPSQLSIFFENGYVEKQLVA